MASPSPCNLTLHFPTYNQGVALSISVGLLWHVSCDFFLAGHEHCRAFCGSRTVVSGEDAMKNQMKELQELKGIGDVLSRRLVESSYDTIAKVAAAEEKGLARIAGMTPQRVRNIVTQARKMTGEAEKSRHTWTSDR